MTGAIGIWIAAFLTLGIFSFLYKDNPIYKFCEALFVGVSAGYWFVSLFWQNIWPKLVLNLHDAGVKVPTNMNRPAQSMWNGSGIPRSVPAPDPTRGTRVSWIWFIAFDCR